MKDNQISARLHELRQKDTLTNEEINELVRLSPDGSFRQLGNATDIGITNPAQFIKNLDAVKNHSKKAFEQGFYLEVISLRLQYYELWLRLYWAHHNKQNRIFSPNDKKQFGKIITDCESLDFDNTIIKRLREFNEDRINAIHKYILGETDYQSLKRSCEIHQSLGRDVQEWVCNHIGNKWLRNNG